MNPNPRRISREAAAAAMTLYRPTEPDVDTEGAEAIAGKPSAPRPRGIVLMVSPPIGPDDGRTDPVVDVEPAEANAEKPSPAPASPRETVNGAEPGGHRHG